jgi:uncharacterized membrane protein YoaK (UPF0700 family)
MKRVLIVLLSLLWLMASAKSFPISRKLQRLSRNATLERTRTLPRLREFVQGDDATASREEQAETEAGTPTIQVFPSQKPPANVTSAIDVLTTKSSKLKSMSMSMDAKKNLFIFSLVTLTGISEAICFRRFGCFPNMMTGNTIRSLTFLADLEFEKALFHAALIFSYVIGGGLFQIINVLLVTSNNKTNNNSNNKQLLPKDVKSTLPLVAGVGLTLFCGSDLLNKLMANARAGLPILALGYGMINAATLNVVGAVTNAITGHWTKVGLGVGDYIVDHTKARGGSSSSSSSKGSFPTTSTGCVAAFSLSVVVTGLLFNRIVARPALLARMPPFGTSFGVLYAILLTWYSQTPSKV